MAIVRDASSPARWSLSGNGTGTESGTSASFTPVANAVLVVYAAVNSNVGATPTFNAPTFSGTGVGAFALVRSQVNASGGSVGIWRAVTTGTPTAGTISVSVTTSGSLTAAVVSAAWCDVWTGADSVQTGAAVNGGTSTTQNFSPTVTTTRTGSQVVGVGIDWQARGVPTSSDTIDGYTVAGQTSGGRAFKAANSGAAGSVALNFNAAAAAPQWTVALLEILAPLSAASDGARRAPFGPGKGPLPTRGHFKTATRGYTSIASGDIAGTGAMVFGQTGALTGAGALAGTTGLTFGQTGALTGSGVLAGTDGMTFSQTGTITGAGALTGTGPMVFGQAGTMTGAGALAGSGALVFGQTGTLTQPGMNGTASMTFGQTGTITGAGALVGTNGLVFGQTGALAGVGSIVGTGAMVFGQSGTLDQPSGAMVGTGLMVFGQSGTLSATIPIVGTGAIAFFAYATPNQPESTGGGLHKPYPRPYLPYQVRGETEEEKRLRRIEQGLIEVEKPKAPDRMPELARAEKQFAKAQAEVERFRQRALEAESAKSKKKLAAQQAEAAKRALAAEQALEALRIELSGVIQEAIDAETARLAEEADILFVASILADL